MRRLLVVLAGTLAAWLGLVVPSAASADAATSTAVVHSYDAHHTSAQHDSIAIERGPPIAHHGDAFDAVDRWSRGDSVRPGGVAPATTTTYDTHGAPVLVVGIAPTTQERVRVDYAVSLALVRSGVAAEGASTAVAEARQVTVLGRYTGGVDSYVGKPGFNTLDLPFKGTGRWNWTRNKRFIDDAIDRGDEIRLVTDPTAPMYRGGNTFQRELKYLQNRGYTWEQQGDFWNAVPR